MTRQFDANNATAAAQPVVVEVTFAQLSFDEGTEYLHSAFGPITWGGNTYIGAGDLGGIERIQEGEDISPFTLPLTLTALDDDLLSRALSSDVYGRAVSIYKGFLALETSALVADPELIWSGTMDTIDVERGDASSGDSITLRCESDMKKFDRVSGLLFTDEQQQRNYAGDLAFEYLDQLEEAKIIWGGKGGRVVFNRRPNPYQDFGPWPGLRNFL